MKKMIKVTLLVVVSICTACSEDFIDLAPFSESNVDNFYRTADDFENAVNATYDVLQDGRLYGDNFEFLLEVRSDNGAFEDPASGGGEAFRIDKFQVTSTNSFVEGAYRALFQGVQRANIVLTRIDEPDFDQALKDRFIAEVRFIRALCYFHLVQLFGHVPLITNELTVAQVRALTRNSIDEIYQSIIADLEFSVDNLPESYNVQERGRATSFSAAGLLAKVYLTRGDLTAARGRLEYIINSGQFTLLDNIANVFSTTNEYNAEILFAVRYRKGEGGEGHGLIFGFNQNPTISENLIAAYDQQDQRLPLVQYATSTGGLRVPGKYFDILSESNNTGNDIPVIRYSDILLMYAEVLNIQQYIGEVNSPAFEALNAVRTRSGLSAYTATDLPNQLTFNNAVSLERRLEFALEFQRWYDLKRTQTAISTLGVLGLQIQDCQLIYPIPQTEIDVYNNTTQFPQNECF